MTSCTNVRRTAIRLKRIPASVLIFQSIYCSRVSLVVGVNIGETRYGQPLQDGGCAVVEDGTVTVAISEERITRQKYDSGFENALRYCLDTTGRTAEEVDVFVVSNCSDRALTEEIAKLHFKRSGYNLPADKIMVNPSHHLAHAESAFYLSPYDEAIVLVADNNGNVLSGEYANPKFNALERTTAYVGTGTELTRLRRYHDTCSELGVGAVYKYVTLYLGFDSYKDAGKVMGLASYGDGALSEYAFFEDGQSLVESRPHRRAGAVRDCLREQGFDPGPQKTDPANPSALQTELAWLLQRELERVLINLLSELVAETSLTTLCYAGGVALNCVANQTILAETGIDRLYIPPAPGDYGQCLGNALHGWYEHVGGSNVETLSNAYLGRTYRQSAVERALEEYETDTVVVPVSDLSTYVASELCRGRIVGLFDGRSEFGPRALGHRSILADPRDAATKDRVNEEVKYREEFRPFAPVVLREQYERYFDGSWQPPCQFMILTRDVQEEKRDEIPAVTHVDGTARLQTVTQSDEELLPEIIEAFYKETGIPVLLNTSFNVSGEPIVERPEEAIETFLRSGMDTIVMGDTVVQAQETRE